MKFLQLLVLVCLASFAFADVIVDEDFEGGVTPAGWQIWQCGDTGATEWEVCYVGEYSYMPDPAHSGTHYAWHDDNGSDYSQSWLVTDTYDFTTYSTVNLSFWRYLDFPTYYFNTWFYYSTVASPGPADFVFAFELGDLNGDEWWEFSIDFSTECAGQANVTFAWIYEGGYDHAEAIDDVLIEAFGTALERDTWGAIKSTF
jgi:hypothetical protein